MLQQTPCSKIRLTCVRPPTTGPMSDLSNADVALYRKVIYYG
jgi:hypothetical protein